MKVIIVGLGTQGKKRKINAGKDFFAAVDPINPEAEFKSIEAVDLNAYDAALVCLPDAEKYPVIHYLLSKHKSVLVEKPLWTPERRQLVELHQLATAEKLVLYTAYNHRFEPHVKKIRELIKENQIGEIYRCRLFYGNGTAELVRKSWRDSGKGVLTDLGGHLLDLIDFWFESNDSSYFCVDIQTHENQAPDHVLMFNANEKIKISLEMSLLSWKNAFHCDLIGKKGSLHIDSLCKWGPSRLIERHRIFPAGKPIEKITTLNQHDPTWNLEYQYFKNLVNNKIILNPNKDIWIYDQLEINACRTLQ